MTEAQWLASHDPSGLLNYLGSRPGHSDRKARLLAVACCRRVGAWLSDPVLADAIDECERCADDPEPTHRLSALHNVVQCHGERVQAAGVDLEHLGYIFAVSVLTEWPLTAGHCLEFCQAALGGHDDLKAAHGEAICQLDLIRETFGNPFRPVAFDPTWRTGAAVALARQMYDARDFGPMPVLADALQEAGCDHPDVLAHCRGAGPHVRGCWVVDRVLGKG